MLRLSGCPGLCCHLAPCRPSHLRRQGKTEWCESLGDSSAAPTGMPAEDNPSDCGSACPSCRRGLNHVTEFQGNPAHVSFPRLPWPWQQWPRVSSSQCLWARSGSFSAFGLPSLGLVVESLTRLLLAASTRADTVN